MPAVVDPEKCNGCTGREREECIYVCAYDAVSMKNGKAVVDEQMCDDCMMCVEACPVEAIITV